jgi:N-acetyl-beta-hexosaminidase
MSSTASAYGYVDLLASAQVPPREPPLLAPGHARIALQAQNAPVEIFGLLGSLHADVHMLQGLDLNSHRSAPLVSVRLLYFADPMTLVPLLLPA